MGLGEFSPDPVVDASADFDIGTGDFTAFICLNRTTTVTFTCTATMTHHASGSLFTYPAHLYGWSTGRSLDSVRWWNRALTTAERDYVYNSGAGR